MPEQKMTYEERLKATAKKHADKYNAGGRREYAGGPLLRNDPEHMMDEAELTVAAQAEAIRKGIRYVNDYYNQIEEAKGAIDHVTDTYLLEHGYIEPKTEEYGK
jgi:hypothetical protein